MWGDFAPQNTRRISQSLIMTFYGAKLVIPRLKSAGKLCFRITSFVSGTVWRSLQTFFKWMLTTSQVKSCTTVLSLTGEKKMEVQEWITCPNSCSCLGVSLGFGLVLIFRNNFLSSLCYLLGKNLPFQVGSGEEKWKKEMKKKKEEERNGGREKGGKQNPHCRPQRQTREQNSGGLSLGIPYNEPQEFSPGSCSPKHQVHPFGV